MASKGLLVWLVVQRFLTVAALVASIAVLVTNKFTSSIDASKTTFQDVITYRFVLVVAGIGVVYSLYQIPFAIYHAHKEKRLIRNECAPAFDFYGDKIMSWLLATGLGAGFAAPYELKRVVKQLTLNLGSDEGIPKRFSFLNRGCHRSLATLNISPRGHNFSLLVHDQNKQKQRFLRLKLEFANIN